MAESTIEAMVRLGGLYAQGGVYAQSGGQSDYFGWGHYDACPAARSDTCDDPDAACICPGLASEYEDERSASW